MRCHKCAQPLILTSRRCDTCLRYFHPSCSNIYLASKQANPCCLKSKLISSHANMSANESISLKTMSPSLSPTTQTASILHMQTDKAPFSLETTLNLFIEQQSSYNKGLTDSISQLTATINKQSKCQIEMNSKLNDLKKITKTLNDHDVRISKLEQHNEVLATRVTSLSDENLELNSTIIKLQSSQVISSSTSSSNVIFSGIPQQLGQNPLTAIAKILNSIDASNQTEDILDIRTVNKKQENTVTTLPDQIKTSFIATFKSSQIAEHIINKKRRHGVLLIKQAFDSDINGKIFINEFLDPITHELYLSVKAVAHEKKCKYVWIKQG